MSVTVTSLITQCATRMRDPNARLTTREEWLAYYNEVQLEVATELRLLEVDADFDLFSMQERYAYPEDAVAIRGIRFSLTPTDLGSYRWLNEIFEDEWRARTNYRYPQGIPYSYCARPNCFVLVPKPDNDYPGTGLITYARTPVWLDSETDAAMELPDQVRTFIADGMMPKAMRARNRYAEAAEQEKVWRAVLASLRDKFEDRSDDRRPALRPVNYRDPYTGMS